MLRIIQVTFSVKDTFLSLLGNWGVQNVINDLFSRIHVIGFNLPLQYFNDLVFFIPRFKLKKKQIFLIAGAGADFMTGLLVVAPRYRLSGLNMEMVKLF